MAIECRCDACGSVFTRPPSHAGPYCSRECAAEGSRRRPREHPGLVSRTCETCGKSFARWQSHIARDGGKFCSRACSTVARRGRVGSAAPHWQGGQVGCVCLYCGGTFYVDRNRVKAGRGKHCSKACYWARVRGETHWKYRHGRGRFPYTGGYTKAIRDRVIERDKVCVDCGTWDDRPRRMQVHHLDLGHDDHSLENLALLCLDCHVARHQRSPSGIGSNSSGQS